MNPGDSTGVSVNVALDRFERAVELPLLLLAIVMIPLLVAPLFVELPVAVESAFLAADWFIWAAFAVEYVVRLVLTTERLRFVRREWPDLLFVALPLLRPLRIARSARALKLLRLGRVVVTLTAATRGTRRLLTRHHLHHALLITGLVVVGSSVLVLAVEEDSGGSIDSFGDALWWAITTVTTVGYGDTFPVTPAGRGIAAGLMFTGIALFGVLTASLATFMIDQTGELEVAEQQSSVVDRLDELLRRLAAIESRLDERASTDA